MFGTPKKYATDMCFAFDDRSLSSSKKKKLRLGSYENKELLKEKGFKWDQDALLWYRNCDNGIAKELKPLGIEFEKGILELSNPFWRGDKVKVGEGIIINNIKAFKEDAIVQFMWKDEVYGDVIRINGGKSMCDRYKEELLESVNRLEKMKQKSAENPKMEYLKREINDMYFKIEKDKEVINYFKC